MRIVICIIFLLFSFAFFFTSLLRYFFTTINIIIIVIISITLQQCIQSNSLPYSQLSIIEMHRVKSRFSASCRASCSKIKNNKRQHHREVRQSTHIHVYLQTYVLTNSHVHVLTHLLALLQSWAWAWASTSSLRYVEELYQRYQSVVFVIDRTKLCALHSISLSHPPTNPYTHHCLSCLFIA